MSVHERTEGDWGCLSMPSVLAAAHELKAPLTLIRQLSYQLDQAGALTSEQKVVQERLRLTSERALRLVENITRASRLEDAMFALEPLQARAVWQEVAAEITPLANGLQQNVAIHLPKKPLLVVAHAELLPAILTGLCDNAMAHNPTGSSLTLSAKQRNGAITFSVRDNGPTIDKKSFENLAARIGHQPQPLGTRPNSSGLGLWIAGIFARAMNAELCATRHRRGGMTFSLHVPISTQLSLL